MKLGVAVWGGVSKLSWCCCMGGGLVSEAGVTVWGGR